MALLSNGRSLLLLLFQRQPMTSSSSLRRFGGEGRGALVDADPVVQQRVQRLPAKTSRTSLTWSSRSENNCKMICNVYVEISLEAS